MNDTPLHADELVREHPDKQAAIAWPLPVDLLLESLLKQATAAGESTSRKELAAAIIAGTTLTDVQLGRLLRRYRTARVRDLLPIPEGENIVPFARRKPGRRSASA